MFPVAPDVTSQRTDIRQRLGEELKLSCQCHSSPPGDNSSRQKLFKFLDYIINSNNFYAHDSFIGPVEKIKLPLVWFN